MLKNFILSLFSTSYLVKYLIENREIEDSDEKVFLYSQYIKSRFGLDTCIGQIITGEDCLNVRFQGEGVSARDELS